MPVETFGLHYLALGYDALLHLFPALGVPPLVLQRRVETAEDLGLLDVCEPGLHNIRCGACVFIFPYFLTIYTAA